MAGNYLTAYKEIWKSINTLMNEADRNQKTRYQRVLEEPEGSPLTIADVIQLNDVSLKSGLNEISRPHETIV